MQCSSGGYATCRYAAATVQPHNSSARQLHIRFSTRPDLSSRTLYSQIESNAEYAHRTMQHAVPTSAQMPQGLHATEATQSTPQCGTRRAHLRPWHSPLNEQTGHHACIILASSHARAGRSQRAQHMLPGHLSTAPYVSSHSPRHRPSALCDTQFAATHQNTPAVRTTHAAAQPPPPPPSICLKAYHLDLPNTLKCVCQQAAACAASAAPSRPQSRHTSHPTAAATRPHPPPWG